MYRFCCTTCDKTETVDDLETAQDLFNDHAERRHEVEITKEDQRPDPGADVQRDGQSVDG